MTTNIFVMGLDEFNHKILKRIDGSPQALFHPLLHYDEIRSSDQYPVEELIQTCKRRLDRFHEPVEGIIGYFDFPSTDMVPIICEAYDLPSASVESVMKIANKLWARMEQKKAIPEYIPKFAGINPENPPEIDEISLSFPFWIKPVRSFKSYLAFKITNQATYDAALVSMKTHVEKMTAPFRSLMAYAPVSDDFRPYLFYSCIAEQTVKGCQCTLEGYVYKKEVSCYGIVDSIRDRDMSPLMAYEYPSCLPPGIREKMVSVATRIITYMGYDNATFNIEFFYNPETDAIHLLEINPRCSQSHAHLFEKVDGASNLSHMVQLARGEQPVFHKGSGPFTAAGKYMVRSYEDGVITRMPTKGEINELKAAIPDMEIKWHVRPGTRLSQLHNQDSYTYEIMDIYLGGKDRQDLRDKYAQCLDQLAFSMDICFRPLAAQGEARYD